MKVEIDLSGLLTTLLLVLFIALKLTHVIAWSWLWVLSPVWLPFAIILGVAILVGVAWLILNGIAVGANRIRRR